MVAIAFSQLTNSTVHQVHFSCCRVAHERYSDSFRTTRSQAMMFDIHLLLCYVLQDERDWDDSQLCACFFVGLSSCVKNANGD